MNNLHSRRIHLSSQRGAAVFVVMMTILVITSLGSWAMYSASLTSAGSGYQRSAAQALYTSELGILAATSYLSLPGYASANVRQAQSDLSSGTPDNCRSVGSKQFCKSIYMADIDPTINAETKTFSTAKNILDQGSAEGSMGPYGKDDDGALQGQFILEMSDPKRVIVPGMDLSSASSASSASYQRVTLTSYGVVRPLRDDAECSAQESAAAALVTMRAHVVVGPIQP